MKTRSVSKSIVRYLSRRKKKAHRAPPGASPDTLVAAAEAQETRLAVMQYDTDSCEERGSAQVAELLAGRGKRWIDVSGLANVALINELGQALGLHPLIIADIVHTHQRPKVELHDSYVVVVMRMPHLAQDELSEQLTLILTKTTVITFQERAGDCFDGVRARLRSGAGRIRGSGPDYLAYTLIDALIDSYFPVLERCGERAEQIEERVLLRAAPDHIGDIHVLKRELLELRHAIWPLREVVGTLLRDDVSLIKKETRLFLRDCADHAFQLLDILEVYREIASGLVDLQLSSISNRMNEAMKVLTVIATIFIPMTFIAGVYGMNFDRAFPTNMPELGWKYGYLFALGLMLISAALIVWLLFRRGWLSRRS